MSELITTFLYCMVVRSFTLVVSVVVRMLSYLSQIGTRRLSVDLQKKPHLKPLDTRALLEGTIVLSASQQNVCQQIVCICLRAVCGLEKGKVGRVYYSKDGLGGS